MNPRRVTTVFLFVSIAVVLAVAFAITLPFLRPVAFAVILAVVFNPMHEKVLRWTGHRRDLASLLSTLLLLLVFGIPTLIVLTLAANEALQAAHYLTKRSAQEGGFSVMVMELADRPIHYLGRWIDFSKYDVRAEITSTAQKLSVWMFSFGANVLGNFVRLLIDAGFTFIVVFFFFREGKQWAYRLGSILPLTPLQVDRLFKNISDTIVANVYGIISVGVVQGLLTGIAMKIVGMPSALLLGLGAGCASIIPVVGSSLIWGPVAIYLLLIGTTWKGVFLVLWGTVLVSAIDNVIRPWVVGGRVELHPMILLFFILGGVEAFGFLGLFFGPVVAAVLAALFHILREETDFSRDLPAEIAT